MHLWVVLNKGININDLGCILKNHVYTLLSISRI